MCRSLSQDGFYGDSLEAAGYTLSMPKSYTAVIERDSDTGLLVGHVPGLPGAHSQGQTLDELTRNLREVIEMLLEDGEPVIESEFVGTQLVNVG
jgi:predicted RNase H-like HicB family nuclease